MTTKFAIASAAAAVLLAGAPVAFAHENGDSGLHLGAFIKSQLDVDHDGKIEKSERERSDLVDLKSHITVGTVTSINGSTFVVDPVGKKSTTTVSTDSMTVFKVKGEATSSSALAVGSKVFLFGTTTATSTAGDSFSASMVSIIGKGLGHLRFWLWFHH